MTGRQCAPDNRRNAGSQFVAVNRLGDSIVGPEAKCRDPIVAVASGKCHERRAVPRRTQASDERKAILMQRGGGINEHKIECLVAQWGQRVVGGFGFDNERIIIILP